MLQLQGGLAHHGRKTMAELPGLHQWEPMTGAAHTSPGLGTTFKGPPLGSTMLA